MSISTKFLLKGKKAKDDDRMSIMLRIIIDRRSRYVSLKKYASQKEWNPLEQLATKRHPDHQTINLYLSTIKSKIALLFISNFEKPDSAITFSEIISVVEKFKGEAIKKPALTISETFEEHIESLKKNNKIGYASFFKSTLKSLENYFKGKPIHFAAVKLETLEHFEEWLCNKNCMITTRSAYFRTFRTLWRIAIKKGYCPKEHYPFADFAFAKYNNPKTRKRAIPKDQILMIENAEIDPANEQMINSRNYFIFSFYCRGINFADLANLKWNNIIDDYINYIRAKTKDEFYFKLHPKAISILDYYKSRRSTDNGDYVFPVYFLRHKTEQSKFYRKKKILKNVNSSLKQLAETIGINKKITTYVARHSFATALLYNGISKEDIGKTLQHEDLKTTSIYLDEIDNPYFDDTINSCL